jgi:hypothetical protein
MQRALSAGSAVPSCRPSSRWLARPAAVTWKPSGSFGQTERKNPPGWFMFGRAVQNQFAAALLPAAPQLREPRRFSAVKCTVRGRTPLAVCRVCRDIADVARRSFPGVVDIRQRTRAG